MQKRYLHFLVVAAMGCVSSEAESELVPDLATVPIAAGAPSNAQQTRSVAEITEYSAVRQAPRIATLGDLQHKGQSMGLQVKAINEQYGVPSMAFASARTVATDAVSAATDYLSRFRGVYGLSNTGLQTANIVNVHDLGRGAIVVKFEQLVGGVKVYGTQMKVVMNQDLQLIALTGSLHPSVRASVVSASTISAAEAVRIASRDVSSGPVTVVTEKVQPVLYPHPKYLEPAQLVILELADVGSTDSRAYSYVIAHDGRILERVNHTFSESFDYRVFADSTPPFVPFDGPQIGWTPHPTGDSTAVLPIEYGTPSILSMDGQNTNPDGTFDPWLAAGSTVTNGNNVHAYADHASPNGFGAGDIQADINGVNSFDYPYNPELGPFVSDDQVKGAIVQLFYTVNWLHDYFYDSGFNEATGVAQANNFGRGGSEGDVLLAEAQDTKGTQRNNANMSTPPDGISPRMQMYVFDGDPVDTDGTIDNSIVAHEWGHYFHHRLSDCNGTIQCRSMSEGWGDFIALHMMIREGDDVVNGVFAGGAYVLLDPYFGIRRVPYSTRFDRNALTFHHISSGQALPNTHPVRPKGDNAAVHNAGEVWSTVLVEAYFAILNDPRYTFTEAKRRFADYIVGGLLASPPTATFLELRDSILAATFASDPTDVETMALAFARRGMGTGAIGPARNSVDLTGITESFTVAREFAIQSISAAASDDCDDDAFWDAGETFQWQIQVGNVSPISLADTTVTVETSNPNVTFPDGPQATLGQIDGYGNGIATISAKLAEEVTEIELVEIAVTVANPTAVTTEITSTFAQQVNFDETAESSAIDTVESQTPVWSNASTVVSYEWKRIQEEGNTVWRGVDAPTLADQTLTSPVLNVGTGPLTIAFEHRYQFEESGGTLWDGGLIEISTDGGANWTNLGAAIAGYDGVIGNTADNPIGGQSAYAGTSAGYPAMTAVTLELGTEYAGQDLQFRFRLGTDQAEGGPGWDIDNIAVTGSTNTPFSTVVEDITVCDAEPGDGEPDTDGEPGTDGGPGTDMEPADEDGVSTGGCGCQSSSRSSGVSAVLLGGLLFGLGRKLRLVAVR